MLKVISPFVDKDGVIRTNGESIDGLYSDEVIALYKANNLVIEESEVTEQPTEYETKTVEPKRKK